ncbi:putative RNA-directed DNA polymerase, eukaryota, reverse transcriptase zinc-binding domain protein [Tanacetum coccineum]
MVGDCFMVNIYGPHDPSAKIELWNRIRDFMQTNRGKYILFGDMNEVRNAQERVGSIFSRNEAEVFNNFIIDSNLTDLPLGGHAFTWMNKQGTKLSKLDRFLISEEVINLLPDIRITALDRMWSDHIPILLHCSKRDFGPVPFKIFHSWFSREGFDEVINTELSLLGHHDGSSNMLFHEKLKVLKQKIKHWHTSTRSNEASKRLEVLKNLKILNDNIEDGSASNDDRESRINLLHEVDKLDNLKAMDSIQKSRLKWDIEGDENSKFFHSLINQKRRANDSLIDLPSTPYLYRLNECDRPLLETNVSIYEIKDVVWDCGSDKAPSLDGFTFAFVKRYWDLLKSDIHIFVASFLASKKMPSGSNSSFITLIPKVANPVLINDFRPISLINTHYKIIAKVIANRLSKVIDKIVNHEQTAFIAGRQILDGPLFLSEVIHWEWIKACLESSRTSILINGSPTSEFDVRRGLRQGDCNIPYFQCPIYQKSGNCYVVRCGVLWIDLSGLTIPTIPWVTSLIKVHLTLRGVRIMPPRRFKKKSVRKIVEKRVAKAIEKYEKTRADSNNAGGSGSTNTGGTVVPEMHGCSYKTFMNGKPHSFKGTEGVVGLKRWFEKMEQVFEICKCAKDDKVKFAMCTFEGRALTWWNGNVQTLGLANANQIPEHGKI